MSSRAVRNRKKFQYNHTRLRQQLDQQSGPLVDHDHSHHLPQQHQTKTISADADEETASSVVKAEEEEEEERQQRATLREYPPFRSTTCPYCTGQLNATVKPGPRKYNGWDLWRNVMKSPKFVVAPMVDASELPFRMMCRKYGADLAYSPMFHSIAINRGEGYLERKFTTVPEDRPLFVQLCGSEATEILEAAKKFESHVDAIDINLGCPQPEARVGGYGAFLMEDWETIHTIIHTLHVELAVPVTAKMRLFDDDELTLRYARMLRDAGAQVIAVHGRTRDQLHKNTGTADWSKIAMVKEAIKEVPVLANGNVDEYGDAIQCLEATGTDGVLVAESLLWDPRLFANPGQPLKTGRRFRMEKPARLDGIDAALEYLDFAERYPTETGIVRDHVLKMTHHSFVGHRDVMELFNENGRAWKKRWQDEKEKEKDAVVKPAQGEEEGGQDDDHPAATAAQSQSVAKWALPSTYGEWLESVRKVLRTLRQAEINSPFERTFPKHNLEAVKQRLLEERRQQQQQQQDGDQPEDPQPKEDEQEEPRADDGELGVSGRRSSHDDLLMPDGEDEKARSVAIASSSSSTSRFAATTPGVFLSSSAGENQKLSSSTFLHSKQTDSQRTMSTTAHAMRTPIRFQFRSIHSQQHTTSSSSSGTFFFASSLTLASGSAENRLRTSAVTTGTGLPLTMVSYSAAFILSAAVGLVMVTGAALSSSRSLRRRRQKFNPKG